MKEHIYPLIPFDHLQGIRFAQALMESRFIVHIPSLDANKFLRLKEVFGMDHRVGTVGAMVIDDLEMSHAEPLTRIGTIRRPLIFPRAILRYCREQWAPRRDIRISFAGLVTGKRKELVRDWCRRNAMGSGGRLDLEPLWFRAVNRFRKMAGLAPASLRVRIGALDLWSSNRGRTFPVKAWDEEYFQLLARSDFVLCPSGDCVWSYRFFESILCGAIPVVEGACKAYEGFIYRTTGEPWKGMTRDRDAVEHNYKQAVERITVPVEQINNELERLTVRRL